MVRLTESQLTNVIRKIILEQNETFNYKGLTITLEKKENNEVFVTITGPNEGSQRVINIINRKLENNGYKKKSAADSLNAEKIRTATFTLVVPIVKTVKDILGLN